MTTSRRLHELMDMRGRVALITGGAGHIGREIAAGLAELGADIVLTDHTDAGAAAKAIAAEYGTACEAVALDLADENATRALPALAVKALGRLDVLINAAAFVGTAANEGWTVPFEEQSSTLWREALEINLTSAFVLSQAAAPLLRRSGHGAIVNIGSIYGLVGPDMRIYEGTGSGNPAAYAASKGGLLQLTRWMATVLAPDIRVNAVTPGGIERGQPEAFQERYHARTPLGRMGHEDDIKGAVAYLASDLSSYVTGQNLVVDGGWTAW